MCKNTTPPRDGTNFFFLKKVILANLVQMRKEAHHGEPPVQLSDYHLCNFQFKTYFGSCVLGGFLLSARLQDFCRRFFIPLFVHFWCVSDVALHWNKCLATIKLTKKWLTSPIEAFHVEKSPKKVDKTSDKDGNMGRLRDVSPSQGLLQSRRLKKPLRGRNVSQPSHIPVLVWCFETSFFLPLNEKVDKSFCRGNFLCPVENLFLARAAKKCPKNVPAKFQGRAISYLEFPKEGHSAIMDRHSPSPKSFLSRPP